MSKIFCALCLIVFLNVIRSNAHNCWIKDTEATATKASDDCASHNPAVNSAQSCIWTKTAIGAKWISGGCSTDAVDACKHNEAGDGWIMRCGDDCEPDKTKTIDCQDLEKDKVCTGYGGGGGAGGSNGTASVTRFASPIIPSRRT